MTSPGAPHSSSPAVEAAGSDGKLSVEQEELLMQAWGWTDAPGKYEVKALASKAGCEEEQVRAHFARLRTSVRSFLQKAQRSASATAAKAAAHHASGGRSGGGAAAKAAGEEGEEDGAPSSPLAAAVQRAGAEREAGLRKLRLLLDEQGGLKDASKAGQLTLQMAHAEAATLRCALLHALLATKRSKLAALVQQADYLRSLEDWLRQGEEDGQATLLLLALQVLDRSPLSPAMLRSSTGATKAVARLQQNRNPEVAAAAKRLTERWEEAGASWANPAPAVAAAAAAAESPRGATPAPAWAGPAALRRQPAPVELATLTALGRKGVHGRTASMPVPVAAGEGDGVGTPRAAAAATAAGLQRQASEGAAALPLRSGVPVRTARPMSADDIRKAKAKERAQLQLQSLGSGGMGPPPGQGGPPAAKRSRLGSESPRFHPPPPSPGGPGPQQAHGSPAAAAAPAWGHGPAQPIGMPAAGGAWHGAPYARGLPPEAAAALHHYKQDRQRRALARRQQLVREYTELEEAASRLPAMQPALPAFQPPPDMLLPPLDLPVGLGEESIEAAEQQARQAATRRAVYSSPAAVPASPAEPQDGQCAALEGAAAPLPFVSIDPSEAAAQNQRLLADGVRLPQYVAL